jgi:predicted Zn-dependent protease
VTALRTSRHHVLPILIDAVTRAGLVASAFVGVMARSLLCLSKSGVDIAGEETDAEMVLTTWTPDGTGIGWAGQAARDWAQLDPAAVAASAIELAHRGGSPVAIEPGRRTAILGPAAVAQLAHVMPYAWEIGSTLMHQTPFAPGRGDGGTKLGELVMDPRVTITSDPADPEGGFLPFYRDGADGRALVPMTWVAHGVLTNLSFGPGAAASFGVRPSSEIPYSPRLGQGTTTLESMIAECREGIYVNRLADVRLEDPSSGVMSGVTQGGCFLIKDGKMTRSVKNLRFADSPFLFLNNLIEIGTPRRVALGYTPGKDEWPLPPVIVPPLMVRDFNFTMLADAV